MFRGLPGALFFLVTFFAGAQAQQSPTMKASSPKELNSLRKKATAGDVKAQLELGELYLDGDGVPQDPGEAAKWLEKAALQGNADAENNLGALYFEGVGVRRDLTEAVKWIRAAAEQGNVKAEYNMATAYFLGQGVEQDQAVALQWYQKAADQGHSAGCYAVARAYQLGRGIARDEVSAYMWYLLARHFGYGEDSEKATAFLEDHLTSEQLKAAHVREEAWLKAHPSVKPQAYEPQN